MWLRWFAFPVLALAGVGVLGLALAGFVILLAYPNLPSIEALTEYQPKIPLRVYTADGVLIGEFGEERRSVVSIEEVPALMKQAILAESDRDRDACRLAQGSFLLQPRDQSQTRQATPALCAAAHARARPARRRAIRGGPKDSDQRQARSRHRVRDSRRVRRRDGPSAAL